MADHLTIASDLAIPLDGVTQTFAILAKRGAGKTYTGAVMAEEMLKAGAQVVVIDPLDAWWGLRSSADGEGPGLPILVLGGEHGDLPLTAESGTTVADLVVEDRLPVVLSLRHLSKTGQRRFVADFAERLYHRKGEDQYRQPVHLIIDEADAFVPQRVMADTARVMGSIDDLVRRGRSSGIGVTLISQRAAVIHKDVLTQTETLIVLKTTGPQDRKAIEAWIEAHDPEDRKQDVLGSLASLPVGTAWVWSPGWLGILQRVQVRHRETFDSSSTPSSGSTAIEPRTLATVDVEAIAGRLSQAVADAEANDPRALRRRIAELEGEVRRLRDRPVLAPTSIPGETVTIVETREVLPSTVTSILTRVQRDLGEILAFDVPEAAVVIDSPRNTMPSRPAATTRTAPGAIAGLRKGARSMLLELARMHPRPLSRTQLGMLAGLSATGGTFGTYLGDLRRLAYVEEQGSSLTITSAGLGTIGHDLPPSPQSTEELVALWGGRLRAGERRMLDVLVANYPRALTREELGAAIDMTFSGGTFGTYLGVLKRNALVEVDGTMVRASETLFLGGS